MLSIGGLNPGKPSFNNPQNDNALNDTDPFAQGVKVFDMTEVKWTNQWNASIPSYDLPTAVKNHYTSGNRFPGTWSDPNVKELFDPTPSSTPVPAPAPANPPKQQTHTAAIAGGTVGGVALLTVVLIVAWLISKKNKGNKKENQLQDLRPELPETHLSEMSETRVKQSEYSSELDPSRGPNYELSASDAKKVYRPPDIIAELPGTR